MKTWTVCLLGFFGSLGTWQLILIACNSLASASWGPYEVRCRTKHLRSLHEGLAAYRAVRICYPKSAGKYPLHLFAHGDSGGGAFFYLAYHSLQEQLASFGFVVPAYLSCWFDSECSNGQASFLQALQTIEFVEQNKQLKTIVDFDAAYSASGHSTGARVVLMLAALRDNPAYLSTTAFASQVTPSMRASLKKLKAVIADHPDAMYDSDQNPDTSQFAITQTPVFLITGSEDTLEPIRSAWTDFGMLQTPDKVFFNVHLAKHVEPNLGHTEGPFIAYFARFYALGDESARVKIFGDEVGSLHWTLQLAHKGEANNGGNGTLAFLACAKDGTAVPEEYANYCDANFSAKDITV